MEIRAVTTLRRKRKDCERIVALYEKQIAKVRADIEAINATIAVLDGSDNPKQIAAHVDVFRLYSRGELVALCRLALKDGPTTTREVIAHIMRSKGLDARDAVLAQNIERRLVVMLGQQRRRGVIVQGKKRGTAHVWQLP